MKELLIDGLYETHIVMAYRNIPFGHAVANLHGVVANVADSEEQKFVALSQFAAAADLDLLHRRAPMRHDTLAARIAYRKSFFSARQLGSIHEVPQFRLIHRSRYDHVGQAPEICE